MTVVLLILIIIGLMVFGTYVALGIGIPSLFYLIFILDIPLVSIGQRLAESLNNFPILAAPLFILAGNLMNSCGVTERIFDFAYNLVKHIRGGLAHANIVASIIFSGMSGSAVADAGGLGAVEIKAMTDRNYSKEFSVGITGASSIIGPIIPPSIPIVMYAVTANTSVGKLFIAGIIPGLLMGACLAVMCVFIARKEEIQKLKRATWPELWRSFFNSFPSLLTIVIIIGGIMLGWFTPTEAAAVTVAYILLIGVFLYKSITWKTILDNIKESAFVMIKVSFIIASAALFGQVIIREQVAIHLSSFMLETVQSPILILLLINIILLILGTFMEQIAAIMIVTPIFLPLIVKMGYSPIQFGIVVILNLMIGLLTPPLGLVLYTLSDVGDLKFSRTVKGTAPFLIPLIISLLLVTFIPPLTTFLPSIITVK